MPVTVAAGTHFVVQGITQTSAAWMATNAAMIAQNTGSRHSGRFTWIRSANTAAQSIAGTAALRYPKRSNSGNTGMQQTAKSSKTRQGSQIFWAAFKSLLN